MFNSDLIQGGEEMISSEISRFSACDSLAINKKSEMHLLDQEELRQFLEEKKAKITLRGDRVEVELGEGWIARAIQFEVDHHLFLFRIYHKGGNNGVAISEKYIHLGIDERFVCIAKSIFSPQLFFCIN